jgi:hypothetical protein
VQCWALKAYITSWTKSQDPKKKNKGCVTYIVALPFTLKSKYLKAREEELTETQIIFHHAKI